MATEIFKTKGGTEIKVLGLGNRRKKKELLTKFLQYKKEVDQLLGHKERNSIQIIREKHQIVIPQYNIEIVRKPAEGFAGQLDVEYNLNEGIIMQYSNLELKSFEQYLSETMQSTFKEIFDTPTKSQQPTAIYDIIEKVTKNMTFQPIEALTFRFNVTNGSIKRHTIYHEIAHYVLLLNCIRLNGRCFIVDCIDNIRRNNMRFDIQQRFIDEGFAEVVSRHLDGTLWNPTAIPINEAHRIYTEGFLYMKEKLLELGSNFKKLFSLATNLLRTKNCN